MSDNDDIMSDTEEQSGLACVGASESATKCGINSPSDYQYANVLRYNLTAVGAWPLKERCRLTSLNKFLKYFHMVSCLAVSTTAITYIVLHSSSVSFFEIGHMYITMMMGLIDLSRHYTLSITKKYQQLGTDFFTKFHMFFYKDKSDYAMKTYKRVHQMSHLLAIWLSMQMIGGIILFNLTPMYNNYSTGKYNMGNQLQNTTFEHSLRLAFPFDITTNLNGYIVACIFYWILSYLCATWFCMFDLFLSLMVFNIWGHLKILIHNLYNFPKPTQKSEIIIENDTVLSSKRYTKDDLRAVNDQLKECIDYHREIVKFTNRVSDVFGPMLLVYHMFDLASGCLLLMECSQMTAEALTRYLPLTIIIFQQLIQISVIFELVGSESSKLKDAVYSILWEDMDPKTRKMVAFFLMNCQKPIHVKAMGLADVGVTTMAFIIKTSLSYFAFLRTM